MLILITLFFFLLSGVTIPKITLPGLEINQFYIKLDKKLIISADRVTVKKRNKPARTLKELDRVATLVEYLPNYFNRVAIKNLVIGKRTFHLLYDKDIFHFDSDRFQIASKITFDPDSKQLKTEIERLLIKEPEVRLTGSIIYDLHKRAWSGRGEYEAFGIRGGFKISHVNDYFSFEVDSEPCGSIKALVDYIDPPEQIKVWIYPNIPAKKYLLHYLKGGFTINKEGTVDFDPRKLRAFATAYDAKIHFHRNVPPVSTPKIDITLQNDTLSFKLYRPVYEGKRLDGSFVKISNLTNRKAELDAHIVVKDKIDESIRTILNAYGIDLPFVQTEGVTDAVVDFTVKLVDGKVTRYKGIYSSGFAKLLFDNVIPLPVKNLKVVSEDSKIVIHPCRIVFDPYLDANLSGVIDLHTKSGSFSTVIERLTYEYHGLHLIDAKSPLKTEVLLDFRNNIDFSLPALGVDITYRRGGGLEARAKELKLLKPFLAGPLEPVESGSLNISLAGLKIDADAKIVYPNDIFTKDSKSIDSFEIRAESGENQLHIRINDTISVIAQHERTFFNIKEIDIDVDSLLRTIESYIGNAKKSGSQSSNEPHLFYIEGHRSRLTYKKLDLPCDFYNVKFRPDPLNIKFETKHGEGEIRGIIEEGKLNVAGKNLPDRVMRGLTTLDQLKGGSFDFNAVGAVEDFNGTILMRDTLWTKTAFYNNLLATLNTIPAILTLKNPGFSKNGFKIKRGALDYRFKDGRIFFKKIVIEGYSAQITGKGTIDLKNGMIALKMQIHFLESLTNILNKIPVAGYLIFGKDGTLAVTLNVKGALHDPKISTEATKDLIKAPLNILERTLTLPFKIFE